MCTQDKWEKAQQYIARLQHLQETSNSFDFKELESIQGFLIYVIRTYPAFTPYLKGVHLTLDSWRPNRDDEGWKMVHAFHYHKNEYPLPTSPTQPLVRVTGVPRLAGDLQALAKLFSTPHPPWRIVRSSSVIIALYGFGDASGEGFGGTLLTPQGIRYRYGLWGRDVSHQSSNFREMQNLVEMVDVELADTFPTLSHLVSTLDALIRSGEAPSAELFLFTDNAVAEGAFFRGTSPNPKLFGLILRLRQLEMHYSLRLHVIHVAGQRMVAQGTDGLSRGELDMGVMEGTSMFSFLPLHQGALDRVPHLLDWLQLWTSPRALRPLQPPDWLTIGHGITGYYRNVDGRPMPECQVGSGVILLWSPPPAAAE
jgi:hypothetical protein